MIHTVYGSATPCHPGGDCCDECRGTRLGAEPDNTPTYTCDDNGNCYEVTSTIRYDTAAESGSTSEIPLPPLSPTSPRPAVFLEGMSPSTLLWIAGAALLVLAFSSQEEPAPQRTRKRR